MNNLDAFAYLRKSRKDIEEEKKHAEAGQHYNTLDRHRSQLLELAKLKNIRIVEIFEEVVSGEFISERPEMQKMLREVELGSVDAILCMDLDRFDPQDENQELTFSIKSLIAREELKTIVKRMQRGCRQSTKEGKSITRKPPYGYLRDENLRLYPDPDTSWVVELIFNKAANGIGQRTIAEDLDRLNIKPPESDQWEHSIVGRILRNEVYIGNIIWGKVKHTKIDGKYEKRLLPRESWQITKNAHTAIISQDLFYKVNAESKRRWTIPVTKDKKLTNPLAGLIICSNCEKSMVRYPRPDRPNDMIRCRNHKCKGIQKGAAFALVEDKILQTLESLIEDFELPEAEKKRSMSTIKLKEKALKVMEKEKKEIEIQSDNIHELLEKNLYTTETFLQRQHVLKEKTQSVG